MNEKPFGFWTVLALVVGNMIGSGVFLLPASLAPYGTNSLWGWLLTAAGALLLAYVFAALSRAMPRAGGPYVFARLAFGPAAGFVIAWSYWVCVWVGSVSIATGSVSYLLSLFPSINGDAAAPYVTLAILWILTGINCIGLRMAGLLQLLTTGLKLIPLIAVAVVGSMHLADGQLAAASAAPFQLGAVTSAATLTLWALLGFESATVPADRVRNAKVVLPRAIIVGTLLTAVIYVIACMAVQLALPADQLAKSNAPFADVARLWWGDSAAWWLTLFIVISGIGCLNGWVLVQAEMPRAMASNGAFPHAFARESRFGTPVFALVFTSGLVTVALLANYSRSMVEVFTFMVLISTSANVFVYLVCSLAAIRLAWRNELGPRGRGFPVLIAVAAIGSIYSLWAIIGAGTKAVLWGFALMLAGLPMYWWTRRYVPDTFESPTSG